MNRIFRIVLIAAFSMLLAAGCEQGPDPEPDVQDRIKSLLDQEWTAFQQEHGFTDGGLGIHLMTPDGDLFASSGLGKEADADIHFRGASTTKTFTAASIMLMHQKGLVNIDDFVTDNIPGTSRPYLPDTPEYQIPNKDRITIRHLLEHRAGVFDVDNDPVPEEADAPYAGMHYIEYVKSEPGRENHTFTFDELAGVAAGHGLSYWEPGTGFHYSNTGYSLLGKIIERASNMDYGRYVQETFVQPLGLDNTYFPYLGTDTHLPSPYARGFTLCQGQFTETTRDNMSPHVAEGNIITTPGDLSRWINLLLSGKAGLEGDIIAMMTDVRPTDEFHGVYGLGMTRTAGIGYGHNGGYPGYLTIMRHNPEDGVAVVLFATALDAQDLIGQLDFMVNVVRKARETAGYPGNQHQG